MIDGRVVADTSVWIEYLSGRTSALTDKLDAEVVADNVLLPDLVLCEVLQGIRDQAQYDKVRSELLKLTIVNIGGAELAIAASERDRYLRNRGVTVRKTVDCLIATFCMAHGHTLLHRDRDFDAFEEHFALRVAHL